jgi:hypothetical protein
LAEGEIGGVGLDEPGAIGAGAGKDATGGNVAPRHTDGGAGLGDAAGKDGVAVEALGFVELAGVDVGLAGIAGGVDEEGGLVGAEGGGEDRGVGVVDLGALEIAEGNALLREEDLISLADVAGTAEEIDHGQNVDCGEGRAKIVKMRVKGEPGKANKGFFRAKKKPLR